MAAARPPPDTPELSDEGSSDDPRIEDVEGVFEMEEGQELGEEEGDEEDEEEEEEEPDYCAPPLPPPLLSFPIPPKP